MSDQPPSPPPPPAGGQPWQPPPQQPPPGYPPPGYPPPGYPPPGYGYSPLRSPWPDGPTTSDDRTWALSSRSSCHWS